MPVISYFLGIYIKMYADEHGLPHFHAEYGEYKISVEIKSGVVRGKFPPRVVRLVLEWLELHREELLSDWNKLQQGLDADKIEGLE